MPRTPRSPEILARRFADAVQRGQGSKFHPDYPLELAVQGATVPELRAVLAAEGITLTPRAPRDAVVKAVLDIYIPVRPFKSSKEAHRHLRGEHSTDMHANDLNALKWVHDLGTLDSFHAKLHQTKEI